MGTPAEKGSEPEVVVWGACLVRRTTVDNKELGGEGKKDGRAPKDKKTKREESGRRESRSALDGGGNPVLCPRGFGIRTIY